MGTSTAAAYPNLCLWLLTGTNIEMSRELSRRIVPIFLRATVEQPWLRPPSDFKHPDLLNHTKRHRRDLLHALLILVSHWLAEGRPLCSKPFGSFEGWASVIGGIIEAAGLDGFLANLPTVQSEVNVEDVEFGAFLRAWLEHHDTRPTTARELIELCWDQGLLLDALGPGDSTSQARRLGRLLRRRNHTALAGLRMTVVPTPGRGHHANSYQVRQVD